ncbi:MAG: hypothetical protein V4515_14255, partial [Chloroflexota bacterium]
MKISAVEKLTPSLLTSRKTWPVNEPVAWKVLTEPPPDSAVGAPTPSPAGTASDPKMFVDTSGPPTVTSGVPAGPALEPCRRTRMNCSVAVNSTALEVPPVKIGTLATGAAVAAASLL